MNKLLITLSFWLLISIINHTKAQDVIEEHIVEKDLKLTQWGKNNKFYYGSYTGINWMIDGFKRKETFVNGELVESKDQFVYGLPNRFSSGSYLKIKMNNLLAVVAELDYHFTSARINRKSKDWVYEKYRMHSFGFGGFLRINFDVKRGNSLGTYLDLGYSAAYNFSRIRRYKGKPSDDNPAKRIVTSERGLNYMNQLTHSFEAHLGFKKMQIVGRVLQENYINNKRPNFQLPTSMLGLRLIF